MRHRIKDYTITGDTDIAIKGNVSVEDVRLIVNETQGEVICSSMKKSNVTCVYVEDLDQTHISFDKSICEMQPNDLLTIEIDKGDSVDDIVGENKNATNTKILEDVGKIEHNFSDLEVPLSAISGLALELSDGKVNIANALNNRGIYAEPENDSLTILAEKIYKVKNPVAFTVPAETSNELANDFFNTMMKSQGYDQIYESVYETYCGEGGVYVGCLMTDLRKGANTGIQLKGADAYYIYDEDIFYKNGEGGKLIQFLNGSESQLTTDKHVWSTETSSDSRIVFYLYLSDTTADGNRENVHLSAIDYCRNSTIPCIKYGSNGGIFMYFHLNNPESCVLSYSPTGNNTRTIFFYSNVETCSTTMSLTGNQDHMYFLSLKNLKSVSAGTVVTSTKLRNIEFPNLEEINGGTLLSGYKNTEYISFPKLKSIDNGILLNCTSKINSLSLDLPELEYIYDEKVLNGGGGAIAILSDELELTIKSGCKVRGFVSGLNEILELGKLRINCDELYTTVGDVSDRKNTYPDISAKEIYFNGLRKGTLYLGGSGGYSSNTKYMYINCIGGRTDEIKMFNFNHKDSSTSLKDIEISENTRQPLTFMVFIGLLPENIVSHIFERLADNRFEDDGITPAPAITISIGSVNLDKLTDAQKAIATDKNYILA